MPTYEVFHLEKTPFPFLIYDQNEKGVKLFITLLAGNYPAFKKFE